MDAINLFIDSKDGVHFIKFSEGKYIKTPKGNDLSSTNLKLIDSIIYDLQKYEDVEIEENQSISGEPLETISLYTLLSTQLDFYDKDRKLCYPDLEFSTDPLLNICPGPEKIDQLQQCRVIIQILKRRGFVFQKVQSYSNDLTLRERLREQICVDFNSSSNFLKSVFINIATIYGTYLGSWCFCFNGLSEDEFATALKYTGDFQWQVDYELTLEKEKLDEKEMLELFRDEKRNTYLRNSVIKKCFNERVEVFSICKKFIEVSSYEDPLVLQIKKGESKIQEFKESLSLDVRKKKDKSYQPKKEKYMEEAVLKTIAGFLNSDGGELFIGVDDKSTILGIKNEIDILHHSSTDKILLHLKNLIKTNIGVGFSNLINISIENLNNLDLIHVICKKSDKEIFVKGKDFYVRLGPSTDKLEGKELLEYSKSRF